MRPDIIPRAIFPDYELSDHAAKHRKLSELQGPHPMVLVLSRGGFCPKDRYAEGLRQRKRLSNSQQPHHVGGPKMAHAGCWAHARRKFFRAVELNPKDQSAIGIVAQIDELFKVDRRAREQGLTPDARRALRLVNFSPYSKRSDPESRQPVRPRCPKGFWPRPRITPSASGRD